ncbi:MAG: glycosyltransferase family 4 protein [Methylococcaceae bacterium]|nr:glycosyltransferase family 4 protein [Methylococcaceae bacterium]
MNYEWLFLLACAAISWILTGLLRRYALAKSLMDVPNARSSHSIPTPRGGGLAIVIVFLAGLPVLWLNDSLSTPTLWALLGAGISVALIGFLDDHGHIPARWRLLAHFFAAGWGLFWLNGLPPLQFFGQTLDLGWAGNILGALYLVWLLNLYNFMDGIDGLASIEAISVALGGILLSVLAPDQSGAWPLSALLLAAVLGFLLWNFPPAKIFMGDAGSGFLGLVLGLLSIQATWLAPKFLWSWLILLGVFIVDATWTLIRRFLRGDKVYEAHRSHGYQFASRKHGHRTVTLTVALINSVWLLPIALWVGVGGLDGIFGLLLAYTPLIFLAIRYQAGELES